MKVLLVTKQKFEIRNNQVYCSFAISSTVTRFEWLGELHVCCYHQKGESSQPLDTLSDIRPEHVSFLQDESSLRNRYLDRSHNIKTLTEAIGAVDLVIGYNPSTIGDLALSIAHRQGKRYMSFLVSCIWDGTWHHRNWKARAMAPVFFLETRRTVWNSDYVWYVTERFLQRRYPTKGIALGCTDTNIDYDDGSVLQRRLERIDNGGNPLKLLTVGHLDVGFKGQQYVIKALPQLPNTEFYMIGAGNGDYLRRLASHRNVENRVHFLGRKTRQEVLRWMDETDVYVQPSLQEGLPRSIAEAMSRAMPVVGSRTGGIPEMLESGFITKRKSVGDIVDILKRMDKETMKAQAARNYEKAKDYQPSVIDSRLAAFFGKIRGDIGK